MCSPPDEAKHYVHSEGPSPSNTRVSHITRRSCGYHVTYILFQASSLPNLRCGGCLDSVSLNSLDNSHILEEKDEDNESDGCMDIGSKEGSSSGQMEDEEDEEEEHVRILFMEVS